MKSIHQALGKIVDSLQQMNEKQQRVRNPPLEEGLHLLRGIGKEKQVDFKILREMKWTSWRESINSNNALVEILGMKNPAPNDNILEGSCIEGLLEAKNHDPKGVNFDDEQNILLVGTLAIDLRSVNYNGSFVLTMSPMVIDTRVCSLRVLTLGTMPLSTIAVDSNILCLDTYRNLEEEGLKIKGKLMGLEFQDQESLYWKVDNQGCVNFGELLRVTDHYVSRGFFVVSVDTQVLLEEQFHFLSRGVKVILGIPEQCQTEFMLEKDRIFDDRGNIDANINGHWNFNNKAMIQAVVIRS
eukprot:Gb_05219 [translate_table: standard]